MNNKIPSILLEKHSIFFDIELIALDFRQNKHKWFPLCLYKPPNQNDTVFVQTVSVIINEYSAQYEHIVIFGDFNVSIENSYFQDLMQIYDLSLLIKE